MIREMVMKMVQGRPEFARGVDALEAQIANMPITPEDLDDAISLLEFVLQHPDKYPQVRAAAIKDGVADEQMLPEQYDQNLVISLLVALYGLQDRLKQRGYARGGLVAAGRRVAAAGRGGDTMLAHINPREAEMLRQMGGSGTINPNTGLHEYKSGKKILGALLPIATAIFLPALAPAIGGLFGASGALGTAIGSAAIGAGSSALSGGNIAQGAILGGLGGGLGGAVGKFVAPTLGAGAQSIIGSGLVGAGAGELTGQGALKGALQGVAGGAIGQLAGMANAPTAFQQAVRSAGQAAGNSLTAGFDPKTALTSGLTAGALSGLTYRKPADSVVKQLESDQSSSSISGVDKSGEFQSPYDANGNRMIRLPNGELTSNIPGSTGVDAAGRSGTYVVNPRTGAVDLQVKGSWQFNPETNAVEWANPTQPTSFMDKITAGGPLDRSGGTAGGESPSFWDKATAGGPLDRSVPSAPTSITGTLGNLALLGSATGLLGNKEDPPAPVKDAIQNLSPSQQEYFTRPSVVWDWARMQQDANAMQMDMNQFMAQNWNRIASGAYNVQKKAMGGALNAVSRFAKGAGSGRADTIDAKLSDGEYVMDAETVSMLGDGSNDEGARRLDEMRKKIRAHKGKVLSKGKMSPNAKSPLAYIKGAL
jgi:hypothetical protein